jgi:hypothetical protein
MAVKRYGEGIDRRAKQRARREDRTYGKAVRGVLRDNKPLAKSYNRRRRGPDIISALKELGDFLNAEAKRPKSERSALYPIMVALRHSDATRIEREKACARLEMNVRCVPIVGDRFASLGMIYPAGHLGTIIRALHGHAFGALHCCRWCKTFFIHKDHRKAYCKDICFSKHEVYRVKLWRAKNSE